MRARPLFNPARSLAPQQFNMTGACTTCNNSPAMHDKVNLMLLAGTQAARFRLRRVAVFMICNLVCNYIATAPCCVAAVGSGHGWKRRQGPPLQEANSHDFPCRLRNCEHTVFNWLLDSCRPVRTPPISAAPTRSASAHSFSVQKYATNPL